MKQNILISNNYLRIGKNFKLTCLISITCTRSSHSFILRIRFQRSSPVKWLRRAISRSSRRCILNSFMLMKPKLAVVLWKDVMPMLLPLTRICVGSWRYLVSVNRFPFSYEKQYLCAIHKTSLILIFTHLNSLSVLLSLCHKRISTKGLLLHWLLMNSLKFLSDPYSTSKIIENATKNKYNWK